MDHVTPTIWTVIFGTKELQYILSINYQAKVGIGRDGLKTESHHKWW